MARPLKEKKQDETLIKQIMREKGIGVDDLAKMMDKTKATVSYQIGTNLTIKTLKEYAENLGVEISDLFPVPDGYVHWTQKTGKAAPAPDYPNFCPNCGKQLVKNPHVENFTEQKPDPATLANNDALTNVKEHNDAFNTNKAQED